MAELVCPRCRREFRDAGPAPYMCPVCGEIFETSLARPRVSDLPSLDQDDEVLITLGPTQTAPAPIPFDEPGEPVEMKSEASPTKGRNCPYCQCEIDAGERSIVCPTCGIPHHEECWQENGGCTTYGCENSPQVRQNQGQRPVMPTAPGNRPVPQWARPAPGWPRPTSRRASPQVAFGVLAVMAVAVVIIIIGLAGSAFLDESRFVAIADEALNHLNLATQHWSLGDQARAEGERQAGEALLEPLVQLGRDNPMRLQFVGQVQSAVTHLRRAEMAANVGALQQFSYEYGQAQAVLVNAAGLLGMIKR